MAKQDENTLFTLVFKQGLAERNRLPIEQVIRTLQEFQEMIREVGRRVQRRNGAEHPDGDFGIELLASSTGLMFRKGSLKANAVATRDLANAQETLHLIVDNVRSYAKPQVKALEPDDALIAQRMTKIGELQRDAKTVLAVQLKVVNQRMTTATLDERAIVNLETLSAPNMKVGALSLYGRLRQLNDRSEREDGGTHIWGELITEGNQVWRLKIPESRVNEVLPLFRKQVLASGEATYFGVKNPRLEVSTITEDRERDYLAAFDAMRVAGDTLFGDADPLELLREIHG